MKRAAGEREPVASAAQSVADFEAVGSLPNSPVAGPQRQSPTTKTVAAFEPGGSLPKGARRKSIAHAHSRRRRQLPTIQQLDDSLQYRLGRSRIGLAGVEYGDSQHIQIAPKPKAK
jgi:hypothetical protein